MTEPIFDLVIADLRQREAQGAETYGKARMMAGDGRDSLRDAYEEALDLVAYLRKAIAERDAIPVLVAERPESKEAISDERTWSWLPSEGRWVPEESDEDYARRMGWEWYPPVTTKRRAHGGYWRREHATIEMNREDHGGGPWLHICDGRGVCEGSSHPTLRAAVDAYAAQNGKSLAQALAEVGEDETA